MDRRLFAFVGGLPSEGLPQAAEILGEAFAVRHAICIVPQVDHQIDVEGPPPHLWKLMPCKRVGKFQEDGQDLVFGG